MMLLLAGIALILIGLGRMAFRYSRLFTRHREDVHDVSSLNSGRTSLAPARLVRPLSLVWEV